MSPEATVPREDPTPMAAATTSPPFQRRTLVLLMPAILTMYGVYQGIQQVLLPAQVEAIDAASKVNNLAILSIISSVAGTIALPLGGAISDRTRSRFGRRAPWIAATGLAATGLCILMGLANTMLWLAIAYGALWFAMNWYQGVIYAVIPDRVPEKLRGTASSVVGLALPLGILAAVNVVSRTTQEMGYTIIAIAFLVTAAAFLIGAPDSPEFADAEAAVAKTRQGSAVRRFFQSFSSFRDRDFSLVFLSRIAFFFGYFAVGSYVFYIITDHIGMQNVPMSSPAVAVSTVSSVATISQIAAVAIFGWVADKFNRRKLVVGLSAFGMALGFAIPLVFPTWTGMLAYGVLNGAATGVYFAVDLALMSLVLPSQGDEGRDLGLLAIATSVPSAFAPAVAALLLNATHTYSSLFWFGAVLAVIGGALVFGVRKVR